MSSHAPAEIPDVAPGLLTGALGALPPNLHCPVGINVTLTSLFWTLPQSLPSVTRGEEQGVGRRQQCFAHGSAGLETHITPLRACEQSGSNSPK